MSHELLIVERYTGLLEHGKVNEAIPYLAENVIFYTFQGIIYGRNNVITYLRDAVRYMHYSRVFEPWRQTHYSASSSIQMSTQHNVQGVTAGNNKYIINDNISDSTNSNNNNYYNNNLQNVISPSQYICVANHNDAENFACFQREGKIKANIREHVPRYYRVRETIVVRNELIAVYTLTRLLERVFQFIIIDNNFI